MKKKSREKPNIMLVGSALACILGGLYSFYAKEQVIYFSLITLAIALLLAALVELRFDDLEGKLDELLKTRSKADEDK